MNSTRLNKLRSYIGFAIKAGKAVFGYEGIITSRRPPKAVLVSKDINRTSRSRPTVYCNEKKTNLIEIEPDYFRHIVAKENIKAIGIADINLSKAVIDNIGVDVNE